MLSEAQKAHLANMSRKRWPLTTEQRFWSKVNKTDSCWLWAGGRNRIFGSGAPGYGVFSKATGQQMPAHRFAYELCVGPIPDGLEIDHLCRNPSCVNPDHLEAVTHAANMRRGANATKAHCRHGHPLLGGNLIPNENGWRICKACYERRQVAHRNRRRVARAGRAKYNVNQDLRPKDRRIYRRVRAGT